MPKSIGHGRSTTVRAFSTSRLTLSLTRWSTGRRERAQRLHRPQERPPTWGLRNRAGWVVMPRSRRRSREREQPVRDPPAGRPGDDARPVRRVPGTAHGVGQSGGQRRPTPQRRLPSPPPGSARRPLRRLRTGHPSEGQPPRISTPPVSFPPRSRPSAALQGAPRTRGDQREHPFPHLGAVLTQAARPATGFTGVHRFPPVIARPGTTIGTRPTAVRNGDRGQMTGSSVEPPAGARSPARRTPRAGRMDPWLLHPPRRHRRHGRGHQNCTHVSERCVPVTDPPDGRPAEALADLVFHTVPIVGNRTADG